MSKRLNTISNILSFVLTLAMLFVVTLVCNSRYYGQADPFFVILLFLGFSIVCGLVCTLFHELGHLIFGKINNFAFLSFTVWFFRISKIGKKLRFDFVKMNEEAGSTEFIPIGTKNLEKRLKSMTFGGLLFSFITMLFSLPVFFITSTPLWLYCFLAMFLPIGAFVLFGNALPMVNDGAYNDGGVIYGINKQTDSIKVLINILKVHAELYKGKTPAEIDETLYFDLPQLPEDDINFITLLNLRYNYYLDKQDYENAKKIISRLTTLTEYMPKSIYNAIKADELYSCCTFDLNEQKADELTLELEKYLNKNNSATNLRVKLAYILLLKEDKQIIDDFYKRALFEASRGQIKGLIKFETKLVNDLYNKN